MALMSQWLKQLQYSLFLDNVKSIYGYVSSSKNPWTTQFDKIVDQHA